MLLPGGLAFAIPDSSTAPDSSDSQAIPVDQAAPIATATPDTQATPDSPTATAAPTAPAISNEPSFTPLDAPTFAAVTMTAEKEGVAPAALVSGYIDDIFTVKATLTSDGDAYGFTVGFSYLADILEFQAAGWEADNPGVPAPVVSNGLIRVSMDSDGTTKVLGVDAPLTITMKFKGLAKRLNPNYSWDPPAPDISFGSSAQDTRCTFFKDSSLRLDDLKNPSTGAFYTAAQTPAEVAAKTVVATTVTKATATVDSWFTTQMTVSAELAPATPPTNSIASLKVGEIAYAKLTLRANRDAYGLSGCITGISPKLVLDTSSWQTDNPGIDLPTVESGASSWNLRLAKDPSGETPLILAGDSLTVIVRLRLANMNDGMLQVTIGGEASPLRLVLFKDRI